MSGNLTGHREYDQRRLGCSYLVSVGLRGWRLKFLKSFFIQVCPQIMEFVFRTKSIINDMKYMKGIPPARILRRMVIQDAHSYWLQTQLTCCPYNDNCFGIEAACFVNQNTARKKHPNRHLRTADKPHHIVVSKRYLVYLRLFRLDA